MSLKARLYIGLVIFLGAATFGYGFYTWETKDLLRFVGYLALALPAACMKVRLPGIKLGTMSVYFVLCLAGIEELNLSETLIVGAICVTVQCFWHSKSRPRAIPVLFSIADVALATLITWFIVNLQPVQLLSHPVRLALAASVYFVANTLPLAAVIALTEGRNLGEVWSSSYFWCFPFYLAGGAIVEAFTYANSTFGWQAGILILPVVYVVYRAYLLFVNQPLSEQAQAVEEPAGAHEETRVTKKMSLQARLYIGFILALGVAALANGAWHWDMPHAIRFLCYVGLAIPASCLKVRLPGVTGTMSMLFIFILAAIVELNLPETLAVGAVCTLAQCFWHANARPRPIQVMFSISTIVVSSTAAWYSYYLIPVLSSPFRLVAAASVCFLANTIPVAIVIALTEGKSVRQVWSSCYFWCFPYYLVGAGIVGIFGFANRMFDWQAGILILPIVYIIYRSYNLYLSQLQGQRKQVEDERRHAAEIEVLHAQTVEALASAMSANARLDAVFRASPLAFLTLDREGKVTSWNATAEQIFGWSPEEVIGQPLPFATGRSEEIIQGVIGRTLRGETISGLEIKQWRKDGTPFDASIWTATLRDSENVSGVLVTVADISDKKRLEEQLRLSQKMEAVGRLAGGVAHDFNNLLTVINGYSSLLIDTVSGHQYAVSQAEEILAAGSRAAELVSQLLTFSRRQMIKPRPFEVNQFVREVERMLQRIIGEHIELRTKLGPSAGWIHADLNQMEGVLLNLSTNARDAMGDGGVLTIETSRADILPNRPSSHEDLAPGTYVRLIVRDTGHGMDAATLRHIFEPFFTTKDQGKGTGLGLASVYGGVEQNKGRIFVTSAPGQGTEFSIYLPRIESPETAEQEAPETSRKVVQGSETILLVEDEVNVRRMLREALTKSGYRVWEAGNGAEAIEQWGGQIGNIDLVVTDIVMPVMNGLRLIEELQKLRPDLRAVCMSGHSEDIINRQSGPGAPLDLLQKPFLPDALVRKVREILDQSHARTRAAAPGAPWRG